MGDHYWPLEVNWSEWALAFIIAQKESELEREEVLELFRNIKVWKKGDKRAPHKPLLLLYALGRLERGETGPVPYDDVDAQVGKLLDEFGPPRKTEPLCTFWYLQCDGLWELSNIAP